jgi:hypothetical protein
MLSRETLPLSWFVAPSQFIDLPAEVFDLAPQILQDVVDLRMHGWIVLHVPNVIQ